VPRSGCPLTGRAAESAPRCLNLGTQPPIVSPEIDRAVDGQPLDRGRPLDESLDGREQAELVESCGPQVGDDRPQVLDLALDLTQAFAQHLGETVVRFASQDRRDDHA